MVVNALVTGLIVFKILKVFLEVERVRGYFSRANIGLIEVIRGYQTSACRIRDNRIRYGVVCHPTGSCRDFKPEFSGSAEVWHCFGLSHCYPANV